MEKLNFETLRSQKTCILGIQGSGKTYWARTMRKHFKKSIIYMINEDDGWTKENMYVWKGDMHNLQADFLSFIEFVYQKILEGKIDLVIIDEADLFFQSNFNIPPKFHDLVLNHRHRPANKGVALWFLTRRPQDIPTKIIESSKHLIMFKMEGANALQKFKEINPQIPILLNRIKYERHEYVYKTIGSDPVLCEPI